MKIAIVGFDREGRASYDYFTSRDEQHEITILDQNPALVVPDGAAAILGEGYLEDLNRFDLIMRTAGLPPQKILEHNPDVAGKISSNTNEFFKAVPTSHIIGVTGTKGKGTTSTLIAAILESMGKTVRLGGNIGIPPLSFIDELDAESWVVLEMSSYQLSDFKYAPHIGVCLLIAPEHLDWHGSFEAYTTAKEQLFARQGTADVAIYYHDNADSKRIAGAGQGQKIPYYHTPGAEVIDGSIIIDGTEICRTDELQLLGKHNWQNVCAAVTACWYCCLESCGPAERPDVEAIRQAVTGFSGLPFRIEFRREVAGVRYYNDSFSSAPVAPLAALDAVAGMKVLILGGYDRHIDLGELVHGLLEHRGTIRKVLVIGAAGERIAAACQQLGFDNFLRSRAGDMPAIVTAASELAQTGDTVVLSPGFPSYDMFKNFEDRGRQFNQAVEAL